jgi:phosphatidylglycerol---prolipoprotein diacylglyceryl transferase
MPWLEEDRASQVWLEAEPDFPKSFPSKPNTGCRIEYFLQARRGHYLRMILAGFQVFASLLWGFGFRSESPRQPALLFDPTAPTLQGMHKLALEWPVPIAWYGVFVAAGFLFGLWTASRRALLERIDPETILDMGPWLLGGTILGARVLYVISYPGEFFAGQPIFEIFAIWHGGLVYYGGLIGASLACVLYAWRRKLPLWKLADVLAPSVALGSFFGRWGCLMNGCCYGKPTELPWGIQFPKGHPTWPNHVHPTQIYDSLLNLVLYASLAWLFRRKKFDGQVFATYLICYAVVRSFVEIFRGDYPPQMHYLGGWATPAQLVSIGVASAGALLLWLLPRPTAATRQQPQAQAKLAK